MDLPEEAVDELLNMAGVALAHEDLPGALRTVCETAVRALPDVDGASLTTLGPAGPRATASSGPWAAELDEMQFAEHEGPCLDASRSGLLFRVRDATAETRWPSYMPRATAAGARSMVSIPMTAETKTVGALNVYSHRPDAFGPEAVSLAEIITAHASLAAQASVALDAHRNLAEQLRNAMASRATIEQAKGIIMATTGCGPDAAFERLVQQSQQQSRKLREVAEELVRHAAR